MKTLTWMFDRMEIAFPMVIERIAIYETLATNNIAVWTPEVEWATLDVCKEVRMTAREREWFARL